MRLLVVEDDTDMADALATNLRDQGMVVDIVGSKVLAKAALELNSYRMILLDRQLPDGDGAELIPFARGLYPDLPIIMLTAKQAIADRVVGLDLGADDYLTKPFAMDELLARIRAIARRPAQIPIATLKVGNLSFDFVARQAFVGEQRLPLPRRQLLVLETLALRVGRTVTREKLFESVYGFDEHIQSNAMDAHISKLRKSLHAAGARVEIHVIRGLGYLMQGIES